MLRCPTCEGTLQATPAGPFTVDACGQCGGVWFDRGELEGHLARPEGRPAVAVLSALGAAPARGPVWRRCPRCAQPMTPRNWERHSGVVVDTCHRHGVWVDGGELHRLHSWADSPRRERTAGLSAESEKAERRLASFGTDTSARAEVAASGGWLTPVLEILSEIPWFFSD